MSPQDRHQALQQHLIQEASHTEHGLSFQRFMHLALYAPGLGYYTAHHPVGTPSAGGDFITAPQMGPVFAYTLAHYLLNQFQTGTPAYILECGAGTGQLALDILDYLHQQGQTVKRYYILEVSTSLRQQQQKTLQKYSCVHWLDTTPSAFEGVIIANELLDALPVAAYEIQAHTLDVRERTVRWNSQNAQWQWASQPVNAQQAQDVLAHLPQQTLDFIQQDAQHPYQLEIGWQAQAWVGTMAQLLKRGRMILIDYGYPSHEMYHPQRHQGTLMAHREHRAYTDVLQNVGLADITAHIDFTAIEHTANNNGLTTVSYTNQARFLIDAGIADVYTALAAGKTQIEHAQLARTIQNLMSEAEMGELFKVLIVGIELGGGSLNSQ